MTIRLNGILVDGLNKPIVNATVILLARSNTITVLGGSEAVFRTDNQGAYDINVSSGHYEVIVGPQGKEPYMVGTISVYADSEDGSLNGYLTKWSPEEITPEIIKEVKQLVAISEQYSTQAMESAAAAAKSEQNSKASETASASSADVAAASEEKAKQYAEQARQAQTSASGSANSAQTALTTIQGIQSNVQQIKTDVQKIKDTAVTEVSALKQGAETAANNAKASELASSNYATVASDKATEASTSAKNAEQSKVEAEAAKNQSVASASESTSSAGESKAAASAAKQSETIASEKAAAAAASEQTAVTSASTATQKAEEASNSATVAAKSETNSLTYAERAEAAVSTTDANADRAEAAADKAEEIAGAIGLEDATLTTKGVVRLSNDTNSTAENLAATPKAVKTVMDAVNTKAPTQSPTFTGTPLAPTPAPEVNNTQIATTQFVHSLMNSLVGDAPEALDTLRELAAALGDDPNFATTMTTLINGKLSKEQNGADIPNKQLFIQNIGLKEIGTSGDRIPLLNTNNTWSAVQTFTGSVTVTGAFLIKRNANAITLQNASTATALYIQAKKSDGTNKWYLGNDTSDTVVNLYNYQTNAQVSLGTTINLNKTTVISGQVQPSDWTNIDSRYYTKTNSDARYLRPVSFGANTTNGSKWAKVATVTMPQGTATAVIEIFGGSGFNVNNPQQATKTEIIIRTGNNNPKGINVVAWKYTDQSIQDIGYINTSGDTYDIYALFGSYQNATTARYQISDNSTITFYSDPTRTESAPSGLTKGVVYSVYNSYKKPTASDVGALPSTGGSLTGGLTASGEIISRSANGLRIAYGNYGFFIRNDGSNTYFMLTASGDSLGTYNNLRPFIISNSTGNVTIATKLNASGGITGSLSGNASTATKLQTARKIAGVSFDGSADITLTAANVSAFALRSTASYADSSGGVPWNAESGVYNVTETGSSHIVANFYSGVGSCRTLQIRSKYKNGGLHYRSSRDGYGFEEDWVTIYTSKDKPTPSDIGTYTKTEIDNKLSYKASTSDIPNMTIKTSSLSPGSMNMTFSDFISVLKDEGAFRKRYWIGFGDALGMNAGSTGTITGFGAIELAGTIIEVFNFPNGSDYTIRLTTQHKADYGGITNTIILYHYRINLSPQGQWLKFAGTAGATNNG